MTPQSLTDGQVVTLLVGLGLELVQLHAHGSVFGPVHPAHVLVDERGRPHLVDARPPPAWTPHDDWVGLIRLGRHLGMSARARMLSWESAGRRDDADLLWWLLAWSDPAPLGVCRRTGRATPSSGAPRGN